MLPAPRLHRFFSCVLACGSLLHAGVAFAADPSFKDVSAKHFAFAAVEYVKQRGLMNGYDDGTFQPARKVNRAEAIKTIVSPLVSESALSKYTTSQYTDVPKGAWFLPYVEWAREHGVIQPPSSSAAFNSTRSVTKAEFLKMFLVAREIDAKSFDDIKLPLSRDVSNVNEWYYPYLRYAVASSMTTASTEGLYYPNREITRSDIAIFLHRYSLYRQGERTQDLLSETEKELSKTIDTLAARNTAGADYTSARALLMMRGAREVRPEEPMIKAVLKVTEGYRALVRAFKASVDKKWNDVVKLGSDAWYLGDQAKKVTPAANNLGNQLQQYAKSFADQARLELKK